MQMSTFGDWLRSAIARRGLTQKTLAELLGVDQGTVSRWAHNRDMKARHLWPLARALRVSPVEVLRAAAHVLDDEDDDEYVRVVIAGEASAGRGRDGDDDAVRYLVGTRRSLPPHLTACRVVGCCLAPEIQAGDIAIVQFDVSWRPGQIVALRTEDGAHVKRVVRVEPDELVLYSNDGEMRVAGQDVRLIGVVISAQREFPW
jgi:transcriptional regulator with XRE-family HTH domain